MVLDDVDYKCLETWLYNKLKPLCVADPIPLSQYVIALIKKNKPENELKDICIDQLEVFLQDNTISFVEDVFKVLQSRSYLPQSTKSDDCTTSNVRNAGVPSVNKDKRRNVSVEGSDGSIKQRKKKSPVSSKSRTCSRSRSRSPIADIGKTTVTSGFNMRTGNRNRDRGFHSEIDGHKAPGDTDGGIHHEKSDTNDDRRRRQRDLDAYRREHFQSQSSRERSNQRPRSRYDEISRPKPYGGGGGGCNNSPRRNERRCRAFEERGFCVYGDRCPYDHGPNALVIHHATSVSAVLSQQQTSPPLLPTPTVNLPDSSTGPVSQSRSCLGGNALKSTTTNKPSNHDKPSTTIKQTGPADKLANSEVVPVYKPTPIEHVSDIPVLPISSMNETAILPSDLSENAGVQHNFPHATFQGTHNNRAHSSFIRRNVVPIPMVTNSSATGPTSTYTALDSSVSVPPAYEPDKPQMFLFPSESSLATIPTDPAQPELSTSHVYTPSPITNTAVTGYPTGNSQLHKDARFLLPTDNVVLQRFGNYNAPRSGFSRKRPTNVLYVTRLPRHLNITDKLFEHFRKFGNLSNIVNQLDGQSDAAMIEFSTPGEADAAYRSPEPLFSNRFIRLSLWPPGSQSTMRSGGFRPDGGIQRAGYNLRPRSAHNRLGRGAGGNGVTAWLNNSQLHSELGGNHMNMSAQHSNNGQEFRRGGRSRWRLERTADGGGEKLSGDEDDDTDEESPNSRQPQVCEDRNATVPGDGTKSPHRDYSWMTLNKKRPRLMSASYAGGDCSTESGSKLWVGPYTMSKKESNDYLRQQQKTIALKQRQEKIIQLDKSLEARQSVMEALCKHIQRLTEKVKSIFDQLERKPEKDSDPPVDRRALLTDIKQLQAELRVAVDRRNNLLSLNRDGKASTDLDSATISSAALQVLPEPLANERRKQIAEVKSQLLEVQTEANILKVKGEPVVEKNRRILELKRQLVDLETVRPTDINMTGMDPNDPSRIQTKLDKRPRTVFITGLCAEHTEDFLCALTMNYLHFQNSVKHDNPVTTGSDFYLEITFRTRDFAEAAIHQFRRFRGHPLHMSFGQPQLLERSSIDKEVGNQMEESHVECKAEQMGCDESTATYLVSSTQTDPSEASKPTLNSKVSVPTSSTNL